MINSLYTAKSGLTASKYAVDTTSNNIANENTEGYKKRVSNLVELDTYGEITGNGVKLDSVSRTTDAYLYKQLTTQSSLSSYYEQESSLLSNIEIMFSETDDSGFSIILNDFFTSLETLRSDSTSLINQNDFETNTDLLVDNIKSLYSSLEDEQTNNLELLNDQVDEVNDLLKQIVYINEEIQKSSTSANNDLLDKRDALELELSNYVNIDVDTSNSNYKLSISGITAIFNSTSLHEVSINEEYTSQKDIYKTDELEDSNVNDGDIITLTLNNTSSIQISANVSGSNENELKNQIVDAINNSTDFQDLEAYLDTSNNLIIKSTKEGEESSFDLDISIGDTIINKDDASIQGTNNISIAIYNEDLNLSSGSIKALTNNLTTSTSYISSYKNSLDDFVNSLVEITSENSSTKLFNGSSVNTFEYIDNSINSLTSEDLENLAQIQWNEYDISSNNNSTTFSEFYQNLLVTISSNVENSNFKLESQEAIVNSIETTYNNLTKVDPDEEMINLLQYQAAYEANAKIITAVDEMLQTLLNM